MIKITCIGVGSFPSDRLGGKVEAMIKTWTKIFDNNPELESIEDADGSLKIERTK